MRDENDDTSKVHCSFLCFFITNPLDCQLSFCSFSVILCSGVSIRFLLMKCYGLLFCFTYGKVYLQPREGFHVSNKLSAFLNENKTKTGRELRRKDI